MEKQSEKTISIKQLRFNLERQFRWKEFQVEFGKYIFYLENNCRSDSWSYGVSKLDNIKFSEWTGILFDSYIKYFPVWFDKEDFDWSYAYKLLRMKEYFPVWFDPTKFPTNLYDQLNIKEFSEWFWRD